MSDAMREAFEAYFGGKNRLQLQRNGDAYTSLAAFGAWSGFQAGAAYQSTQGAPAEAGAGMTQEAMEKVRDTLVALRGCVTTFEHQFMITAALDALFPAKRQEVE